MSWTSCCRSALRFGRDAENQIEFRSQFAELGFLDRCKINRDQIAQLLISNSAPESVALVAGMALDIALRGQHVLALELDLEMHMRRTAQIWHGLDCAEQIL